LIEPDRSHLSHLFEDDKPNPHIAKSLVDSHSPHNSFYNPHSALSAYTSVEAAIPYFGGYPSENLKTGGD